MSADRYEITDTNGLRIDGIPWRERGLLVQYAAIRQQARDIAELRADYVLKCTEYNDTTEFARGLIAERDELRGEIARHERNNTHIGKMFDQLRADLAAAVTRASSLERTIATLWMRLRRAGQLLIEEIGACGPENADDTAERAAGLIRKQADTFDALSSQLGNLLAVIHRDGGHYESEHGTEKACADAELAVHVQRGIADGYHGALKIWRQRAEQAEARLAAIEAAPTVCEIVAVRERPHIHMIADAPPIGTELIARPAKD